nr:HERV-H LTR-associating protein 1 isoform X4 [Danio rerio]|eukprot:XP_009297021.1 HERV-H LTR-associating protein 1 isoform X4 [Danio rerio]
MGIVHRMAELNHWISIRICAVTLSLFLIHTQVPRQGQSMQTEKRELLVSTEIPAEHIDPASIDLTGLVNTLINASQPGSQHLFSLLSVTSHSSLSLQKLTLLVYNISNVQEIESSLFSLRYCYCLTNRTNDLTDFTAILLDVMGNSTSYLQELFKSSSILSVRRTALTASISVSWLERQTVICQSCGRWTLLHLCLTRPSQRKSPEVI